ncbi:MAG TPA: hypothetical protein VL358_04550 [Caulobacteraceae bacterium]|jgi:hypothetical protein|nr:hypothetical protein [Caulobacteraceae bacterium]
MSDSFGFRAIKPQLIDDAALLATNVVETAPAAYAGGTTYALAAKVSVAVGGNAFDVYTSRLDANTGHAPASSPTWWARIGQAYGAYDAAKTYADKDRVVDAANHLVYEGVGAGNLDNPLPDPPGNSTDHWLFVRASNPYAMFDQSSSSRTVNPDEISVTLQADGLVTGVALDRISAATVRIVVTDAIEGVVQDETIDLASYSGIDDFDRWFFSPPRASAFLPITDLFPYADATIEIILSDPGNDVACGTCVIGYVNEIGGTQWGSKLGFTDYSTVAPNDFGDRNIVVRPYTDDADHVLWVDNDAMDAVMQFFKDNRATPMWLEGDDRWGVMHVYGIVTACSLAVPGDTKSALSLTLGGLS